MKVVSLDAETASAWAELFESIGCNCFCRWWHFEGTKNDWLMRYAVNPDINRQEQLVLAKSGAPAGRGLLALEEDRAIGWMKLAPRDTLPKLLGQGPYRALSLGTNSGIWSIGCLLVHPARRGSGVGRALLQAAPNFVRAWGGATVEAYPRRTDHRLHDEEAWMGTADLLTSAGFVEVQGEGPYPVMRRNVDPV